MPASMSLHQPQQLVSPAAGLAWPWGVQLTHGPAHGVPCWLLPWHRLLANKYTEDPQPAAFLLHGLRHTALAQHPTPSAPPTCRLTNREDKVDPSCSNAGCELYPNDNAKVRGCTCVHALRCRSLNAHRVLLLPAACGTP